MLEYAGIAMLNLNACRNWPVPKALPHVMLLVHASRDRH